MVLLIASVCAADNNSEVTASRGETFEVRLSAAASAGYRWEVQSLPAELQQSEGGTDTPPARPGDPVRQIFRFKAEKLGKYTITFGYKRSWETTLESTHTVMVTVR